MGLGLHGGGVSVAKALAKAKAKVLVTDLKTKEDLVRSLKELQGLDITYVLGQHRQEDFINADLIIKNPAVRNDSPYLKVAVDHHVPIETEISLFFQICPAPIIGVTGTKGKSTVASLIYELLKHSTKRVYLGGNIRKGVLDLIPQIKKEDLVVLELSSWQLESLASHRLSPHIAILTNIFPDHLNTYKDFAAYVAAKKNIFAFQKKSDYVIFNYADALLRGFAKIAPDTILWADYHGKFPLPAGQEIGAFARSKSIYFGSNTLKIMDKKDLALWGEHNVTNALLAINVASLYKIPLVAIQKILSAFTTLEGRMETIGVINGVTFINDTTATSPGAVIASLRAILAHYPHGNITLIAGGADKATPFEELAEFLASEQRIQHIILLPGSASDALQKLLSTFEIPASAGMTQKESGMTPRGGSKKNIQTVKTMDEAVQEAAAVSSEKDIVVLSPAAASFNLFTHEFDRGEKFSTAARALSAADN